MSNRIWKDGNCIYRIKRFDLYDFDRRYYNEVLYYPDNLNEGLIKSYNAKSSETFLKSIYPNIVSVNNYNTGLSEYAPSEFDCSNYKIGILNFQFY